MNPLETYLRGLLLIHSTGAAVPETSYYGCLERLLNEVGKALKVRCVINLANRGAGIPDGGLFTPDQIKTDDRNPMQGQAPSRGVIEVKSTSDDVTTIAAGEQVGRYCKKYGLVLVTNYRDFTLVARDPSGKVSPLESYRLAAGEEEFWTEAAHPRTLADKHGERFTGYLLRAMRHNAPLADPKDLAWFLASYARDALARVKGSNLPAMANLRKALEESLGMEFRGDRGEHFFESTLIQTLFYGVFSAWVLWAKEHPPTDKTQFDWMHSASYLRVPVLRKLFHEAADPGQLDALNLSEVLNWATTALNRVDRAAFFDAFEQHHAVQYFYEPFLKAYDPELRKQLGVWYTPPEIVQYMVKRVDRVLREELAVEDGLADPRVYVLDPCCGTGAFLVCVLDQIAATLRDKGGDALVSHDLKTAVQQRVFGFEILPAPYVVSHLQLGLRLADLGVPLKNVAQPPSAGHGKITAGGGRPTSQTPERVGVYLTNALTGWEPPKEPQARLPFVEFQEEHDAADGVKQTTPILVILGNPPYNGFADVAVEEERDLLLAYRQTKKAPKPQGQGLNDLYVRFFRMAERRIVDKTHKGIVCFISNYSWLDGLSHTGMRERYIEAFDRIWIDCLNGDKYKTGKLTPDGKPDPSVFSTEFNREGIQVGTAITLMVRKEHAAQPPSAGGEEHVAQPPSAGGEEHVAQPPSAGGEEHVAQPPSAGQAHPWAGVLQAKPSSMQYRRNLPHIQNCGKPLYITFCTRDRWALPDSVRSLVIRHCLHDHGRKYWLHSVVVMPDHVHMILSLYRDAEGTPFGLAEIMNGIKGASAHSINKALGRKGSVWQDESFDHVLRSSESVSAKADYMWNNPVRKGLVETQEQWPWFWEEWMDLPEGCAPCGPAAPGRAGIPGSGCAIGEPAQPRAAVPHVLFRHLWGKEKRAELLASADNDGRSLYQELEPPLEMGFPFTPVGANPSYLKWPLLTDLFPFSCPGVSTCRDDMLVEIDKEKLVDRMRRYFDKGISNDGVRQMAPGLMKSTNRFQGEETRAVLVRRGFFADNIIPYAYRPFDIRWVYWDPLTKLLDEKRPELFHVMREPNLVLTSRQKAERAWEGTPFYVTASLGDYHLTRPASICFPLYGERQGKQGRLALEGHGSQPRSRIPNLSRVALQFLGDLQVDQSHHDVLWMHALAIGHSAEYLRENAGALWQNFPRVPMPTTREALEASAALGRQIAALLDLTQGVKGVTTGKISPELKAIGLITHVEGKQINDADDLAVTAGWGNPGRAGITMPAGGDARERDYTPEELTGFSVAQPPSAVRPEKKTRPGAAGPQLGDTTFDIYLNDKVYWRNIPAAVWKYALGGYQVIKKWLSYREKKILGRPLRADEARYVTEMARRIAAILLMHPALDENYRQVIDIASAWPKAEGRGRASE